MAIQQFGESLLGDIRKRRQDEERRNRKRADREALLGLGVNLAAKVGNEMLANKAQDFLKQEKQLVDKLSQNKSYNSAAQLSSYRTAITAGGNDYASGDVVGYAMTNMQPELEARAKENLSNVYMQDSRAYGAKIRQETRRLAEEWASDYNEAIILADEIMDKDSFEAMLKLNAKKARPENWTGYITKGVSNLFGGKSNEDFEEEAFEAITDEMEDVEKLNTFMTSFKTFGNMVRAYEFTEDVFPKEAFNTNKTEKVITKEDTVERGDNFYRVKIETKQNLLDPTESSTETVTYLDKDESGKVLPVFGPDPKVTAATELKAQLTIFNPAKLAVQEFSEKGFAEFLRMSQKSGVENPSNPQDTTEYLAVSNVFNTLVTQTKGPGVLKDPSRREIISDSVNVFMTGIMTSEIIKTQMSGKSIEERNSALADIMRQMYAAAEEAYGTPEFPKRKDYGLIPYRAVETSIQQQR